MRLSFRGVNMPASPIRKLVPYAEAAKKRGIKVYHLNIGQPDIPTPKAFFNAIRDHSEEVVAYSHSAGIYNLREAFSKYYQSWEINVDPDEIIITNGGSEAIIFAIGSIADPGDELIVIEPFYANYKGFSSMLNVKLVPVSATVSDGYRLPPMNLFEKALSDKTRGIIFSNPSNPTGVVYTREELENLLDFARAHDLFVIADEVYREFVFDGKSTVPVLSLDDSERIIIVDSISKRYSACGARVGTFITKNRELYNTAMKFAQARLSPPTMAQVGTIGLLTLGKDYTDKIKEEYQKRRDIVFEELSKIDGVVMHKPEGAFYISVKLPVKDSEDFVRWMLTDFDVDGETTMVAPLQGFYATPGMGASEIRIAYVLSAESLRKACEIIRLGLEKYPDSL